MFGQSPFGAFYLSGGPKRAPQPAVAYPLGVEAFTAVGQVVAGKPVQEYGPTWGQRFRTQPAKVRIIRGVHARTSVGDPIATGDAVVRVVGVDARTAVGAIAAGAGLARAVGVAAVAAVGLPQSLGAAVAVPQAVQSVTASGLGTGAGAAWTRLTGTQAWTTAGLVHAKGSRVKRATVRVDGVAAATTVGEVVGHPTLLELRMQRYQQIEAQNAVVLMLIDAA